MTTFRSCVQVLLLATSYSAFAEVDVAVNNTNIAYVGRWNKPNGSTYHSYWGGAYLAATFHGYLGSSQRGNSR